jgi:hypothetical protein
MLVLPRILLSFRVVVKAVARGPVDRKASSDEVATVGVTPDP